MADIDPDIYYSLSVGYYPLIQLFFFFKLPLAEIERMENGMKGPKLSLHLNLRAYVYLKVLSYVS